MLQCEHITGEGTRCFSPAMHRRPFCYIHWRLREHKLPITEPQFELPLIDSEASVVLATSQVAHAVLSGQLDATRARVVLASLRMAVDSMRRQQDVTEVTEIQLTDSMYKQFAAEAHAKREHERKASPAPSQLPPPAATPPPESPDPSALSSRPSPLSSRAERSGARDLLLDRPATAPPENDRDLEPLIDQHPLMNIKPPTLANIMA
jgi:hypothetical protein